MPVIESTLDPRDPAALYYHGLLRLQQPAPNIDEATLVYDHVTEVLKKKRIFNFYTYGNVDPDLLARLRASATELGFGAAFEPEPILCPA